MQIPQGIHGWTIFLTGLLIVAYRIHGVDAPRKWVEWIERQFTYIIQLRFLGGILLVFALVLAYYGELLKVTLTIPGTLFLLCIVLLALSGFGLLLLQNHTRHIVFATAESSDRTIMVISTVVTIVGLSIALAPFFF